MLYYIPKIFRINPKKISRSHTFPINIEEEIYSLDDHTKYKGVYSNRYHFLLIYLLATIDLENVITFPKLAYFWGGAPFIILYLFLSVGFGIPMFIIESGLSQFYSVAESKLFKIVPYLRGLGFSILIFNIFLKIKYSIIVSWILYYFIYSFPMVQSPWLSCDSMIPGRICVNIINDSSGNFSQYEINPSIIFYEFEVKGSKEKKYGTSYTFHNALHGIRGFHVLLIVLVWIITAIFSCFFVKLYIKFSFILLLLSTLILLTLTIRFLFLPGSLLGVFYFLRPNIKKLITFNSLYALISHIILSLCFTKGNASFASLNHFKYDFLEASYLIIFGNFCFSFLSGIMTFSIIGFVSLKSQTDIDKLMQKDFIFVNFIDSSILNSEMKIWVFFCMFMLLILSISSIAIGSAGFSISCIDFMPDFMNRSEMKKLLICLSVCFVSCFTSLFFSLKGSILYLDVFTKQIENSTCPLIILCEVLIIQFLYGVKRLRLEMKMMLGYTFNIIWTYCLISYVPLACIFVYLYSIYSATIADVPYWAILLAKLITIISISPIIIDFLIELFKNYRSQTNLNIIRMGFKTGKIDGPYYKRNWLLSNYYMKKLVDARKDSEFLKTVRETENLEEIINSIKAIGLEIRNHEREAQIRR